jgi:hypothetical protein
LQKLKPLQILDRAGVVCQRTLVNCPVAGLASAPEENLQFNIGKTQKKFIFY